MKCNILAHPVFLLMQSKLLNIINSNSITSVMKAFDYISTCDVEVQHYPDFILGWVCAAISVLPELPSSLLISKIFEEFLFCIVSVKGNWSKSLAYQ